MAISPARTAAFDILYRIESEKAFSSVLLPEYESRLSANDRSLCHELTLGVLRRQICLDHLLSELSRNKKLDIAVRVALRIGIYQLAYLDRIPAYSAINDSVNLVARAKKSSAKSFVNAILRTIQRDGIKLKLDDETERLSVETSHPVWLLEKWSRDLGKEAARSIAESNNCPPQLAFRLTARGRSSGFDTSIYISNNLVTGSLAADTMDTGLSAAAENGDIYFQDPGSQLVGNAVGAVEIGRFLDVCAAPGSKTTQVAAQSPAATLGNLLVAGDLHWPRVHFLRQNCRAQGVAFVQLVQYDAAKALPFENSAFNTVLVDAPCSGTGTIRHNPEIRYFIGPSDFENLSAKQLGILKNASKLVKRGGILLYSTCSLEPEENEEVCERFLAQSPEFRVVPPRVPECFVQDSGFARTFPHLDGMDGFFLAAFLST